GPIARACDPVAVGIRGGRNLPPKPTFCVEGRPQGGTQGARLVPDCRDLPLRYLCRTPFTRARMPALFSSSEIQLVRALGSSAYWRPLDRHSVEMKRASQTP